MSQKEVLFQNTEKKNITKIQKKNGSLTFN